MIRAIQVAARARTTSHLLRSLAFLVGFFLGHPLAPDPLHGARGPLGPGDRIVATDIPIVLAIVVFLVWSLRRGGIAWPRYTAAFVAFWLSCLVSLLFSRYFPAEGLAGVVEVIIYLYLFASSVVLYGMFRDEGARQAAIWGVLAGALSSMAVAYSAKFLGVPSLPQHSTHLQGTFRNGGQLGTYLTYVCILLLPWFVSKAGRTQKALMLVVLVAAPFTIFLASKRAAMAAYGVLLFSVLTYAGLVRRRLAPALAILLAAGLTYYAFSRSVFARLAESEKEHFVRRTQVLTGGELEERLGGYMLEDALALFARAPLTGSGIGMAQYSAITRYEIHNAYLKLLGEGGLLMFACGIWLFVVLGLLGAVEPKRMPTRDMFLVNCYRLAYIAFLVINLWGWGIRRREFWFVIAFIEAIKTFPSRAAKTTTDAACQEPS